MPHTLRVAHFPLGSVPWAPTRCFPPSQPVLHADSRPGIVLSPEVSTIRVSGVQDEFLYRHHGHSLENTIQGAGNLPRWGGVGSHVRNK